MKRYLLLLVMGCFVAAPAVADVLHLRDGTELEGRLERSRHGWTITADDGTVTHVRDDQVQRIVLSPRPSVTGTEMAQLESLRRATAHLPDIETIIQRFEAFAERHAETPAGEEAEADLVLWRQRLEQGFVRHGGQWIDPAEREQARQRSLELADQAAGHMHEGRLTAARPLLDEALGKDPDNPSAWYLRGIWFYRNDRLAEARDDFQRVAALVSDHSPTLNNLAVILWRQDRITAALEHYEQAMRISPMNQQVLDNVAEALNVLPRRQRDTRVAERVERQFAEQDTALQEQMSRIGRYRWGATWVGRTELDRLLALELDAQSQIDAVTTEIEDVHSRIARIERDIDTNLRSIWQIRASRFVRDPEGRPVHLGFPRLYFDLHRDIDMLESERAALLGRLEVLEQRADRVHERLPTPRYTGVQSLIGIEGTPVIEPSPAS